MTKWAFVDYENVGSLKGLNLSGYQRIEVFCGPKNPNIKLDPEWHGELNVIKLRSMGKNNLDMHLALHLGRRHETADPATEFHVMSKDGGFDGVLDYLEREGRVCLRLETDPKPKLVPKNPDQVLSDIGREIVDHLSNKTPIENWPKKKEGTLNWIWAYFQKRHPEIKPVPIFAELLASGFVRENDGRVAWNEEKIRSAARPPLDEAA